MGIGAGKVLAALFLVVAFAGCRKHEVPSIPASEFSGFIKVFSTDLGLSSLTETKLPGAD